jgi:serine/threonine protein phosphatase 1
MSRTLVFTDVHGAARALEQVLERARFDPGADRLVCLGDVCDGWPEVDRCIDLLLDVPDLTLILGNHDEWALGWMRTREALTGWYAQGGRGTVASYARRAGREEPTTAREAAAVARTVPRKHRRLLSSAAPYHTETRPDGRRALFVHAGWTPGNPPDRQDPYDLRWGRELWTRARLEAAEDDAGAFSLTGYDVVFLGHTPTNSREPERALEIWNLDQGAGWSGVLTLMDADSGEYWRSDPVDDLYPGVRGRGG